MFGGPFVSFVGSSKTPEEVEAERAAREARRASKAADIAARKFARDDAKRAKRELIRRATEEERMFRAVLEETKRAAAESLPRRRGESAAHAACVLVTPGGGRGYYGRMRAARVSAERAGTSRRSSTTSRTRRPGTDRERRGGREDRFPTGTGRRGARRGRITASGSASNSALAPTRSTAATAGDEPAKIPADAFFASLDQMSANGQGACTLACVALAEWLEDHPGSLPTARLVPRERLTRQTRSPTSRVRTRRRPNLRPTPPPTTAARRPKLVFDAVIAGAAAEWRALCDDASLLARFPDRHFDLDTALERHVPFPVPDATGRIRIDASCGRRLDGRRLGGRRLRSVVHA